MTKSSSGEEQKRREGQCEGKLGKDFGVPWELKKGLHSWSGVSGGESDAIDACQYTLLSFPKCFVLFCLLVFSPLH